MWFVSQWWWLARSTKCVGAESGRGERERGPQLNGALWERQWAHWAATQNTNSHIMPESLKTPTLGDNGKLHGSTWPLLNTHTQWQHLNKTLCYLWNSTQIIPSEFLSVRATADGRRGRAAENLRVYIHAEKSSDLGLHDKDAEAAQSLKQNILKFSFNLFNVSTAITGKVTLFNWYMHFKAHVKLNQFIKSGLIRKGSAENRPEQVWADVSGLIWAADSLLLPCGACEELQPLSIRCSR